MSVLWDPQGRIRGLWVALFFAIVAVAGDLLVTALLSILGLLRYPELDSPRVVFLTMPTFLAGIGATVITWLALKEPTGLVDAKAPRRFLQGFAVGGFALTVCCLVPLAVGATTLHLTSQPPAHVFGSGVVQLLTLAPAGIGEELLLRGLGLQALRRGFGDGPAVAISSVVFGALHVFNPGATWLAALMVALVGAWFGAVTVRTGSLWMAMGLHVAWNFFEGFVFGQPVSGNTPGTSLFLAQGPAEPGFWSGGAFGPEAAGWTAVVLTLALALTLALPRRSAALT